MNYKELQDYALLCSLEHHLCNLDELTETPDEILERVEAQDEDIIIYEPYEFIETSDLVESIEDMRGVHLYNFMHVLKEVNGEEWVANFKNGDQ